MPPDRNLEHPDPRRRAAAALLYARTTSRGRIARLTALAETDASPSVRSAALSAVVTASGRSRGSAAVRRGMRDTAPDVRRRACELAPRLGDRSPRIALRELVDDPDSLVAEAAAFALGEHPCASRADARVLCVAATGHQDPLVREAAVAALGSVGHPEGRAAVLEACTDKPAIRRRAVLALAAFEGSEVELAIEAALHDRDWQVRDAAALLSRAHPEPE